MWTRPTSPYPALAGDDAEVGDPAVAVAVSKNDAPFVDLGIVTRQNVLVDTTTGATLAGLVHAGVSTTAETSGGGLFDTAGRLLGILVTPSTGFIPLAGLVVPIGVVDSVRQQIEATGKVTHGWLGLTAQDTDRSGAEVTAIVADGPAAKAKLEFGDVIVRAGGAPVAGVGDLMAEWRRRNPGETMSLVYRRGNVTRTADATLTGPPPPTAEPAPADAGASAPPPDS